MKKKLANLIKLALVSSLIVLLAGCFTMTTEELYSMPQLPEEYQDLQMLIDGLFAEGAEYSAPATGSNRSAVQLQDINHDGSDEAVAFLNFPGEESPLKIYIFSRVGNDYVPSAVLEGEGTSIDSVDYVDMDGDGVDEIIVGWQLGSGISMLYAYSVKDFQVVPLISTDYSEYTVCRMNTANENRSIMVFRLPALDATGQVEVYSLNRGGEIVSAASALSSGVESISRIRSGRLLDDEFAVYVESTLTTGALATDIFVYSDMELRNIVLDSDTGVSDSTVRTYNIYSRDLNGDGVLEVPSPVPIAYQNEQVAYWLVDWYAYRASSVKSLMMTTYHNLSDGWYLEIPEEWHDNITVHREDASSGERAIVFSRYNTREGAWIDFLAIYAITGDNRMERAATDGRILLDTSDSTAFAAKILDTGTGGYQVKAGLIQNNFHIIYAEWMIGER